MAKTLAERITSAKNSKTARITDLEQLISEAAVERDRLSEASVSASSESVDFALSDDDRDEAAAKAERFARTARGLDLAVGELREKLEEMRSSEAQKADEAERKAVLAERDNLASKMRSEIPQMVERIVELLTASKRNAENMQALRVYERDAESEARDVEPNDTNILRFATMKLPNFHGNGRAWPPVDNTLSLVAQTTHEIRAKAKAAREAESARWKRYVVEPPATRNEMIKVDTDRGEQGVYREPKIYRMTEAQAEAAREKGCTVRLAKTGESVGLPQSAVAI